MELAIIILNWNAAADTVRCVRNVASWKRLQPAILVVDNGSADGSCEVIARECPEVHLIRNSTNLGFAGGNNRGIVEALSVGDAPILLLNNDAWIEENDVIRLLETLQANEQVGLIGPLLFDAGQRDRLLAAGSKDPSRHHHSHNPELPAGGPVHIVECVPGTVILGRAEVFRTVGLLDKDYFFASEVADLCLRARQHGYLSAVDTRARAFHDLGRSSKLRETLHSYYIIRNRFLLIRKFHRKWRVLFYGFWTLYSLALSIKVQLNGHLPAARAVRLGLFDGLRGQFGDQNERVLAITFGAA
jgi:GT2 family glycosyltransferase